MSKIALSELLEAFARLGAHRLGEVAEGGRLGEVQLGRVVVGQDQGEDGVLHQVVVGAAGQRVEVQKVLEVGQLLSDPALSHPSQADRV